MNFYKVNDEIIISEAPLSIGIPLIPNTEDRILHCI